MVVVKVGVNEDTKVFVVLSGGAVREEGGESFVVGVNDDVVGCSHGMDFSFG